MGRLDHFTQIACGRTAWARPESNAWFLRGWNEFAVETRNAIPLEGQYPENVQEYNARLNPVNEVAYDIAHDNRKAANSILSVIGLIERSDEEKPSRKVSSLENQIAIPIGIASDVFDEIVTIWVVNLAERLLVFPVDGSLSFCDLVISQYREMGPYAFFFAGMPSSLVAFFTRPEYLERALSYAIFRVVVALVSSGRTRQLYVDLIPLTRNVLSFGLELLQHPFRLHATLQRLGMVSASRWFPESTSLVPFFWTSSIRFGGTPLPILAFFIYRPVRTAVLCLGLIDPISYFQLPSGAMHARRRGSSLTPKPVEQSEKLSLSTLYLKVSGFFSTAFSSPSSSSDSPSTPEGRILGDDVLSSGGPLPTQVNILVDARHTTTADSAQMTANDVPQDSDTRRRTSSPPLPTPVPAQPREASGLSAPEQNPLPELVLEEEEEDRDDSAESTRQGSERDARIRISSQDENSTMINLELETYAAPEEPHQQIVEISGQAQAIVPSQSVVRRDLDPEELLRASQLSYQPLYNAYHWVFRGILSVVLLPVDALVLRQLASYYLKHGGSGTSTTSVGMRTGLEVLSSGSLWSWTNAQLISSHASKIGLCLVIRYLLDMGIMAVNSTVSVWIGRRFFGWGSA